MDTSNASRLVEGDTESLRRRMAELEAIASFHAEFARLLRAAPPGRGTLPTSSIQEVLDLIRRKFEFHAVAWLVLDEAASELALEAASGEAALSAQVKRFRVRLGEGLTGRAAQSDAPVSAEDVTGDTRYVAGPVAGTRSEYAAPVRCRGRVVGVLDAQDRARARFGSDLAAVLEAVASQLGLLLEPRVGVEETPAAPGREDHYRAIVENAAYPIMTLDPGGAFTWANRATHTLLGYGRGELDGVNVAQIIRKGHIRTVFTAIKECAEGLEIRGQRIEITTRRREDRTVEMSCNPLRAGGKYVGLEMTLRDITDKIVIEKLKKNYTDSLEEAVITRTSEIKDTQRAAILAIANLAESIDDDTGGHIQRIQHYTRVLAEEMRKLPKFKDEITEEYVELIHDLSPLHDLGKVGIRDYILQKTDKLTVDEFEKMKEHTVIGAHALYMAGQMTHRDGIFSIGEMIAHYHHEKWDGTGYPAVEIGGERRPLRGEEIPLCARIVALADVYDALTSKRPYKMPFPHETTREMIVAQSGKHFDPEVVQAFLRREPDFIRIREQFPDTAMPPGKPFELPARDRV
jgi:PAS domain S-box-containing protein